MTQYERFIGPLPLDVYQETSSELNRPLNDQAVELSTRALYGQKMARLALAEAEVKIENDKYDHMTKFLRRDPFIEEVNGRLDDLYRHWPNRTVDNDSALFIMLDIVGLHDINNLRGHQAGDEAIESLAHFIRRISRTHENDLAGRLGGDEFAIFMPYKRKDVRHEPLIGKIMQRIERARKIDDSWEKLVPPFRYRYFSISPPSSNYDAKMLLAKADPKQQSLEPLYSYPMAEADSLFK